MPPGLLALGDTCLYSAHPTCALDPGVTRAGVPLPLAPVGRHLLCLYCGRWQSEQEDVVGQGVHEQQRLVVRHVLPGMPSRGLPRFQVPPKRQYLGVTHTVVESQARPSMYRKMPLMETS